MMRIMLWGTLVVLAVAYSWPGHPSAGQRWVLDIVLHVGLFALLGLIWGIAPRGRAYRLAALAVMAALLEVLQWWLGGYQYIEIMDVVSNEIGVAVAVLFYWGWSRLKQAGSS